MSVNDPSSSSASQSPDPADSEENRKCQICNQQSHGNHFGAITCRACAAFFRRAMVAKAKLNCRQSNDECVPNSSGRWYCKKCRLNRCLSLNMIPDNIQRDRDSFSTSVTYVEKRRRKMLDMGSFSQEEEISKRKPRYIVCETRGNSSTESSWVDMTPLVQKAKRQLIEVPIMDHTIANLNCLEKLTYGLKQVQKRQKDKLTEAKKIGQMVTCCLWENEVSNTAKWLMYCDEFRSLNCDQRLEILKCIWHVWNRIERVAMTARMRTKQLCGETQFVISHEQYVDYNRLQLDMEWLTNYNKEQLKYFLHPVSNWFNEYLVPSFIELDPTDTEITYILCNLCFYYTGKKLGAEIQEATDRLQEKMANNLHEYYINKGSSSRYSHRLKKLLDTSHQYQKSSYDRSERFQVGSIFDVFKINFSHPEMFQHSC